MNVDYKIASKTLSSKLCKVIPKLVHSDQSGFVKGRFIGESVHIISDIMDFTKSFNKPGILLFLDFEKAFDSLEWNFLFKTLSHMNFGSMFISYVNALYTNTSSCIMNNGLCSKYVSVGRGVRQGDPLSPYLFILAIELLPCKIREDPNINGISVNDVDINIIQYADDTTCALKNVQSVHNLFILLVAFSKVPGLKLNISKSQAMWLSSNFLMKNHFMLNGLNSQLKLWACSFHMTKRPLRIVILSQRLNLLKLFLIYGKPDN